MKKLLIITYYWPPSGGSGVQRWLKFAKYLPQLGWEPIVYTPENPDFSVQDDSLLADIPPECVIIKRPIWEPYSIYRRLMGKGKNAVNFGVTTAKNPSYLTRLMYWIRGNFLVPDPRRFWVRPSVSFLAKYLKDNKIDAVVTTGPPHSMHLIGLGLKEKTGIKWVVDMRDPWASFDILRKFNLGDSALKKQQVLEQKVLHKADAVIMVSESLHELFQDFDPKKNHLIHNGYDHLDFEKTSEEEATEANNANFNIYHTGLLNDLRNPLQLWLALADLCEENSDFDQKFKLHLVGHVDAQVESFLKNHPILASKTVFHSYMSHDNILLEYPKASLFLLLMNNSDNAKAQITGKVYEYLAARKPILALGPMNSNCANIIKKCEAGYTFEYDDFEKIKDNLLYNFKFFQENKLHLTAQNQQYIEAYSRKNLTKKLVELLEQKS